ncbi:proline-rich protein 19 isoform X2 [Pelodiscus sinensis]|uniref:proline-rich protein 19 isoform X2 n=1 Tax=Pelodiscus sinensis TaxID=13735 RepID=UPI003F6B070E
MNPCSRRGAGDESSRAPCGSQLMAAEPGHNGAGQRPGRVQRRKTKRERNSARFGRNAAAEQRPGGRVPQRVLPPGWGSHGAGYAKSILLEATRKVSSSLPVIITQHRLSQHLGMFNREVKSADIERLLGPQSERETSPGIPGALCQAWEPCPPGQASFPDRQPGASTPAPCTTGKGPHTTPAAREPGPSHSETVVLETGRAPPAEKENVPPKGAVTREPSPHPGAVTREPSPHPGAVTREPSPHPGAVTRELARELQTRLDLTSMFLGRNLVSEQRQTILRLLLDRHQTLPSLAALVVHDRRAGDSALGALRGPGARGQELPLDPGSSGSRSSEQGTAGKRRREQEPLCFGSPSPAHVVVKWGEERATWRDLQSRSARKPAAAPSRSPGSAPHKCTGAPSGPQAPGPWPRGAPCCGGSVWEPRTRLERATVAFRQARKESADEGQGRGHWLPFAVGDSGNPSPPDPASRSPWAEPSWPLRGHRWSPKLWPAFPTQAHHQRCPLEPHSSPCPDAGLRTMERAASASFHVLRRLCSPSQAGEASATRVLAWPRPGHRAVSGELCSDPKLSLQAALLHRQGPDPELLLTPRQARRPRHASGLLPMLGKPRGSCQKPPSVEPGGILGCHQPWDSRAATGRTWDVPVAGGGGGGANQLPMGGAQQLRALQLPMSFFPPSEALEHGHSPLPALHRQLEDSSPEAWAFPRMKLY